MCIRDRYDPIQSQGQGHEPLKVGNPSFFKSYLLRRLQWELATDHGFFNYGTIIKFEPAGFLIFVLVLCHVTLNLAESQLQRVDGHSHTRLMFKKNIVH